MQAVHQHTLFHLVDNIKLKRFKLSRSRTPQTDQQQHHTYKKYWSRQQQKLFFNIISKYGADYSMLKHHFPTKSRRQIKNKCSQIEQRRKRDLERVEEKRAQDKRKDYFDHEVMQLQMIKWHNSKPNKPENVTEPESN